MHYASSDSSVTSQGPQSQKTLLDFLIELPPPAAGSDDTSSHHETAVECSPPVGHDDRGSSNCEEEGEDQSSWMTSLTEAELLQLDSDEEIP